MFNRYYCVVNNDYFLYSCLFYIDYNYDLLKNL